MALNSAGPNELHRAALAANGVAIVYVQVPDRLRALAQVAASAVRAPGAHGQTVCRQPIAGTG